MSTIIELQIGAGDEPGTYTARVLRSAGVGAESAEFRLDVERLIAGLPVIQATVIASALPEHVLGAEDFEIHHIGRQLFDTVFTGSVLTAYRASAAVAKAKSESLQVRLRLTDPRLAALPWESLYDSSADAYLCRKEPFIRQYPRPDTLDVLQVDPPLRVLAMVATPRNLQPIDVKSEQLLLRSSLGSHIADGRIQLEWLNEVTWTNVHDKLLSAPWHVLHFIGHGSYDPSTEEGLLAFVGHDGDAHNISARRLADLLDQAEPTPRLVVINSCMSGAGGRTNLFSGTAAALVHSGINAVAAMQFAISDPAALAFSHGFYTALAYGRRIDEAVVSGRIGILGLGEDTLEWVTPVLCLRGDETRLFDVSGPPAPVEPGTRLDTEPRDVPQAAVERAWSATSDVPGADRMLNAMLTAGYQDLIRLRDARGVHEPPPPPPTVVSPAYPSGKPPPADAPPPPPQPKPSGPPTESEDARRRRIITILLIGVLVAVVVAAVILIALSLGNGERRSLPADLSVAGDSGLASVHVRCEDGQHLHLSATDDVQDGGSSGASATPDGMSGVLMADDPIPSANHLALIGRLGGTTFVVGTALSLACPAAGDLELGVNDGEPAGNTGEFTVSIQDVTGDPGVVPDALTPTTVKVEPKSPWTSTPVVCEAGAIYRVHATGTMSWGNPAETTVDADGVEQGSDDPGSDPSRSLEGLEDEERGMLVGALDAQPPYTPLGVDAQFTCDRAGQLHLGANDLDFDDNDGGFVVTLTRVAAGP
ncbi:CHAT domain-containing protein [Agromyces mariniharenae]|uniref:CHAT domain-containing protein n=1 Tax=Agromyces mariniharenae TaxID=2604423 RepID=A0A5S4V4B1_9MICO|nr:CHAT domain-containing protein [Agromyces mariniharenae]TYL53836.1 CHAT domain-containing protein [Agromyces mariniharenae]